MTIEIKLTASELNTMFVLLSARSVAGLPDHPLLPQNGQRAEDLFEQGFNSLVQRGWIKAEGRKFNSNHELFLYLTALVQAKATIEVTRGFQQNAKSVTYYFSKNSIIEQYLRVDNLYCITPFETLALVTSRMENLFKLKLKNELDLSVSAPEQAFQSALKQAKLNNIKPLTELLGDSPAALSLSGAKPIGMIKFSQDTRADLTVINEFALVHHREKNDLFSVQKQAESVRIRSISQQTFGQLIQEILKVD